MTVLLHSEDTIQFQALQLTSQVISLPILLRETSPHRHHAANLKFMREVCPTMVPASDQNRDLDRHQDQHESHDQNLAENPKRSVAPLASCGKSTSALNDLPSELRVAISLFLDASDLCRLACGCKMLNDEIAENTQLWREVARTRHKLPPDAIIETSHENDRVFARARDMDGLTLKQMVSVVQQFPESVPSRLVLSTRRYPRHPSVSAEVLQLSGLEARMKPDVLLGSDRCLDTDHPFPVPSRLSRFHFHCIGNNKFSPLVSPIEYFEVTIGDSPVLLHPNECVAIGLRLKSCRLNRRQPG